jgi:hypothetical protein
LKKWGGGQGEQKHNVGGTCSMHTAHIYRMKSPCIVTEANSKSNFKKILKHSKNKIKQNSAVGVVKW